MPARPINAMAAILLNISGWGSMLWKSKFVEVEEFDGVMVWTSESTHRCAGVHYRCGGWQYTSRWAAVSNIHATPCDDRISWMLAASLAAAAAVPRQPFGDSLS